VFFSLKELRHDDLILIRPIAREDETTTTTTTTTTTRGDDGIGRTRT
jgi:hypothetical protein